MKTAGRYLLVFFLFFVCAVCSYAQEKVLTRDEIIIQGLEAAIDQARVDGTEQSQKNFNRIAEKLELEVQQKSNIDEFGVQQDVADHVVPLSQETTQKSFLKKRDQIESEVPSPEFDTGPLEIIEEAPNPQDVRSRLKKIELALQMASHNYQTDDNFPAYYPYAISNAAEKDGKLYGLYASYTYRRPYKTPVHKWQDLRSAVGGFSGLPSFVRLEGDLSFGEVSYDSYASGKRTGFDAWQGNIRLLGGYDFLSQDSSFIVTPYTGIGYRRFSDKTGGWVDDVIFRYAEYENVYNYVYLPVGVETLKHFNDEWDVGFKLEGSFVFAGTIDFNHSDIPGIYNLRVWSTGDYVGMKFQDDSSPLKGGFGFKTSLKTIRKFDAWNIFAEPFFELWQIRKSRPEVYRSVGIDGIEYHSVNDSDGSPYKGLFEAANCTLQFGMRLGVQF